eukprot:CAMPEP_0182549680 /NCGR_PEP_ID=MMETSP1323-20130603/40526_1 /TAXON_ID=236787 /ORGANISM="Florenciella parvula, Strain RCC1693" /LENGTH=82 /DNA_ID=CAMNT_0024761163 /DNA_START=163 /DNA_END=408 /DNA_ORIENTATION=-
MSGISGALGISGAASGGIVGGMGDISLPVERSCARHQHALVWPSGSVPSAHFDRALRSLLEIHDPIAFLNRIGSRSIQRGSS